MNKDIKNLILVIFASIFVNIYFSIFILYLKKEGL